MHLKVAGDARLENLDKFLRQVWLECCGHLSAFRIEGNELKKSKKLRHALSPGIELVHEYDEEMLLPVVNSPRTGVCGYAG
ncbi:hypothetical protein [Devosia sp.]|uniref:hypothetical protein n=1 Tax=Devosia sp. TaxID=1871048 RepID=UPI0027345AA5|nr:hypothetical protein [Devosia sp.]MDP2782290.1 hypothetical protein [Devosia sp.]